MEPGSSPLTQSSSCLEKGDAFLLLDLPSGFVVGCDTLALTTQSDKKLIGFRDFPPGAHLVWVSGPSSLSRCGYWFVSQQLGRVRVKQWDRYNELLGDTASQFEAHEHVRRIDTLYSGLLPHDYSDGTRTPWEATGGGAQTAPEYTSPVPDSSPKADNANTLWRRLTYCISAGLLNRVTGKKNGASDEWLVDTSDSAKGELQFPQASQLFKTAIGSELSFLFPQGEVDIRILNLAGRDHKVASTAGSMEGNAADVIHNGNIPDVATEIINLLDHQSDDPEQRARITEDDLVGELQFAFLTGLHLGNLSCVDQWWHLVLKVILRAHRLAVARPALCRALLRTLRAQLVYNDLYITGSAGGGGADETPSKVVGGGRTLGAEGDHDGAAGIFDMMPRNRSRLREALTVYKRQLSEALLDPSGCVGDGGDATRQEAGAAGRAFDDLEAWLWRYGWDLRSEGTALGLGGDEKEEEDEEERGAEWDESGRHGQRKRGSRRYIDDDDDDDEEYLPVVVELDDQGKEVGLVSWTT